VVDLQDRLSGTVGLREIVGASGTVGNCLSPAVTAFVGTPAVTLIPTLTDGVSHAVVVVDQDRMIEGVITQTDLLSAIVKLIPSAADR
jgi:CBS domain-containing membrane protein